MELQADFNAYIQQVAWDFMARPLLFGAFNRWLQDASLPRFCWISGGPGSGKTSIAAWLCQISNGVVAPPQGQSGVRPGFFQAYFFCSARDSAWIDPFSFTDTLAQQLAALPAYAAALVSSVGPSFVLKIDPQVSSVSGGRSHRRLLTPPSPPGVRRAGGCGEEGFFLSPLGPRPPAPGLFPFGLFFKDDDAHSAALLRWNSALHQPRSGHRACGAASDDGKGPQPLRSFRSCPQNITDFFAG